MLFQRIQSGDADVRRAPLHIDVDITGLDEKIPDPGGEVLHHQLAPVVLHRAVPRPGQKPQHLIPQPSLGKRDAQNPPVRFAGGFGGLGRRCLPGRAGAFGIPCAAGESDTALLLPFQFVQIQGKPHRPAVRMEPRRQGIVLPAPENRTGQPFQKALKHQPVIVVHVVDQRQVQPQFSRRIGPGESAPQFPQFPNGPGHGFIADQFLRLLQDRLPVPGEVRKGVHRLPVPGPCLPDEVRKGVVFPVPQKTKQAEAHILRRAHSVEQSCGKPHMARL